MSKEVSTFVLLVTLALTSCNQTTKQEAKNEEASTPKIDKNENLLIGSWIEPIPSSKNEFQGFTIKNDGSAESINMATLVYKKWWKEANKLVLVAESIGNSTSSIDTTKYEIVKLNQKELELKDNDYSIKYKKQ
jgi:hypothetical protein